MASVAAIPFVGWMMAPGVGASVFAEATGFASAAGGIYEIPSYNFMVNAHAGEAMMPANIAGPMRDLFSGGAGGGGGSLIINVNFTHNGGRDLDQATINKYSGQIAAVVAKQFTRNPALRGSY